jgi:fatty acid desaturase
MIKKIKNFCSVYGYFYFKLWLLHSLVIASLLAIDIKYFFIGCLVYLILMPLQQLVIHEYVSHEYVVPKNQYIDLFLLLFLFYAYGFSVKSKREYHINHHRFWQKPDLDPTQQKMHNVPLWKYVFGFQQPLVQNLEPVKSSRLDNNRWVQIFDSRGRYVYLIYTVTLLVLLPIEWFVVICIYYPWLLLTVFNFHDQVFHGKISSKDRSWYLPLFGNQAWHLNHHDRYREIYYGPGFWKWVNPSYYYQLGFFNLTNSSLK